ncbi:MAG: UDP-glucose/GDP-mannose dehydrogenase family protein [Phycisphaerae bacterium]|nr:UDP-glucose/GDP-mannose dehydrogenase family protein [Phycisphaerae bacterium]
MNISVIGLGKLGLCSAACFASRGHRVIGVDSDPQRVRRLQRHECPIDEPDLEEMLAGCWDLLEATDDVEEAVGHSDVTLIIVPTPSGADGRFDNGCVGAVLTAIGPALARKETFTVVDVVSTVMPGSCRERFAPLLETLSGRRCGRDFGLVYNPEFIAIGSVIRDFLNPDMVLIGASDARSAEIVRGLYESTCLSDPHIACMSLINAEIAKLSLNCYVTMKISFANELASVCEQTAGADIDVITEAIGSDSRVGAKYLKGGLGFGGPCFPRDNIAFQAFADEAGVAARLSPSVVAVNLGVVDRLFGVLRDQVAAGGRVAVLGLSYKPRTHLVEESQSVQLVRRLAAAGYRVVVHDPKALEAAREVLGEAVAYAADAEAALARADAVVLMTDWPQYRRLDWARAEAGVNEGAVLLDCWRMLREVQFGRINYIGVGLGGANSERMPLKHESAAGTDICWMES